jgi:transcription elongation factor Elf1
MTIAGERFHGKAEEICRQFEINLGCSVRHLHRAHQRLVSSCQRCGERKNLKTVDGYPGEKFVVCGACGAVISYDLHPSAIV